MRLRLGLTEAVLLLACSVLVQAVPALAGDTDVGGPIDVSTNTNTAAYYNEYGLLRATTNIPSSSAMAHRASRTCTFTADETGTTSDGQTYVPGQQVTSSHFLYIELNSLPTAEAPGPTGPIVRTLGPLNTAQRLFAKYCDNVHQFQTTIWVSVNDPFLDPRPTANTLLNNLQLIRPTIYTNPVVDRWGGLITRYPTWLAIQPDAWQPQRSNVAHHRGWTIYLHTTPHTLEFDVNFTPNPDKPTPPFHGIVTCVNPTNPATSDTTSYPAMPTLPEQTEPGTNGPCMWTPPGPGHVTIQARITYTVTLWVNGYTEPLPDYTWTSTPTTYQTGELSAVNINT